MIKLNTLLFTVLLVFSVTGCRTRHTKISLNGKEIKGTLVHNEDFTSDMDHWTVEQRPGGSVTVLNEQLDIDDANGCTVWFNHELKAPLMIEYDAVVVDAGGPNDRVSDLNCFWLATDIHSPDDFFKCSQERGGKFQNYHDMRLYYVGLGGHDNTKTRFRRYAGGGERPCLPEHDLSDSQFLITANALNQIRIVVFHNYVQYYRNGQLIYDYYDEQPYKEGYFGIRTFKNHMTVDNFKVYQLDED